MSLLNCSVFNHSSNKTAFHWCILSTGDAGITVQQFYEDKIICELQKQGVVNEMQLKFAFLGNSKDSLDRINRWLSLDSAIQLFGPFFFLPHLWWTPRTIMLQCDECGMWRLLYSQFKLTKKERANLQAAIEDISFTCGAQLQDLGLSGWLNNVYTRELLCEDPIEKLYYSAKYRPICTYCAEVPKDRIHNVHVFTSQWCSKHVYFQPEFLW